MKKTEEIMSWLDKNKDKLAIFAKERPKEYSSFIANLSTYTMIYELANGKYKEIMKIIDCVERMKGETKK